MPGDWGSVFSSIARDLSDQYYLRFTDTGRLPGQVTVRTGAGTARGTADLPVSDPVAPPSAATEPPPPGLPSAWDTPLLLLAALLIVVGVGYGMGMLAASRRDPRPGAGRTSLPGAGQGPAGRALPRGRDDLFFVFVLPCLNEEKVILASLRRLLSISGDDFVVLVVDDGSDDSTVDAVSTVLGERVWLLSRKLPQARQGKGEALNAATRYLTAGLLTNFAGGREPNSVGVKQAVPGSWKVFDAEMAHKLPGLIVDESGDAPYAPRYIQPLRALLAAHYVRIGSDGTAVFYLLRRDRSVP